MPMTSEQARKNGATGGRQKGQIAKSTQIALDLREKWAKALAEHADPIIKAAMAKAETGDVSAIKEAFDRVMGKSVETITHNGDVTLKIDL